MFKSIYEWILGLKTCMYTHFRLVFPFFTRFSCIFTLFSLVFMDFPLYVPIFVFFFFVFTCQACLYWGIYMFKCQTYVTKSIATGFAVIWTLLGKLWSVSGGMSSTQFAVFPLFSLTVHVVFQKCYFFGYPGHNTCTSDYSS